MPPCPSERLPNSSPPSGSASPASTSRAARIAAWARCASSPRSHRHPVRRHEREALRSHHHAPSRNAAASSPIPFAPRARVDPLGPLCHSARIAICASARSSPRSCTPRRTHRRSARSIQLPSATARALIPAVQSNWPYPPCFRTTDTALFVKRHRIRNARPAFDSKWSRSV